MFVIVKPFQPSLMFVKRPLLGKVLGLSTNIRIGWKGLPGTYTRGSNFALGYCVFLKKAEKFCSYEQVNLMQNRPLKLDV